MDSLRVGVMLDGLSVPEWQLRVVEDVLAEPGISVALFILGGDRAAPGGGSAHVRSALEKLDRRLHSGGATSLRPRDLEPRTGTVPIHRVAPVAPGAGVSLGRDDVAAIAERQLDVILQLGFAGLAWPAGAPAFHGAWTLEVGDARDRRDRSPAFWETYEEEPLIPVALVAALPDGRRIVLHQACFPTHPYSLVLGQAVVFGTASAYFVAQLRRLRDRGRLPEPDAHAPVPEAASPNASAAYVGSLLLRSAGRELHTTLKRPLFDFYHWMVAIAPRRGAPDDLGSLGQAPFRLIEQPPDRIYADPVLFDHEGETWLFVEMCPYERKRGVLAVAKLGDDGTPGPFTVILERDSHLSWPFVFRHEGRVYLIPETHDRGTIELFRCERFPDRWTLDRILVEDVGAVDTVFFEHGGRVWLFSGVAPTRMPGIAELHLFHADRLQGPWVPHPRNPVVSDVRRSRPAGAILVQDGRLVRPGQDCSVQYGHAITFSRIERLTPDDYEERAIARVGPDDLSWCTGAAGTHTFSRSERFLATDICKVKFRGPRWLQRVRGRTSADAVRWPPEAAGTGGRPYPA